MKHLGKIEIGGSLDITNNKHVEDLIEEAIQGIDIPEDTNTTYTLTQDGLAIQLVDDGGKVVSEIEIPVPEYKDPSQEVIEITTIPSVNLFDAIHTESYEDFELTSEYDEENNLISIYLHLGIEGIERTFTLADNASNEFPIYNESGGVWDTVKIEEIYKRIGEPTFTILAVHPYAGRITMNMDDAQIQTAADSGLNRPGGLVLIGSNASEGLYKGHFEFPDTNEETVSDPEVITATLEEHLQRIYESIHNS